MLLSIVAILFLLVFLFLGLPVAFCFILISMIGTVILRGWNLTAISMGAHYIEFLTRFVFSSMPLFFFMGQLGYHSGLMEGIFDAGRAWLGRLKAGLALTVVLCCTLYAACTTLAVASILIIGRSAIPAMRKAGYSDAMATGVLAGSSTLANLIPPTTLLIMYGIMVGESIGKLLTAAWIPGFLSAAVLAVFAFVWARKVPRDQTKFTWRQRIYSIRYVSVIGVTIFALMGGIYFGWATPTEAGAIGAFTTLVVAIIARKMTPRTFWRAVRSTCINIGTMLIIIASGAFFARFLALAGFNKGLEQYLLSIHAPRIVVFLAFAFILLVLGCFIDVGSMLVITLPLMYPIMMKLGYDSVWFAIEFVMFCQIAALTPPYAVCLFAIKNLQPDIPMSTIIRGASVFVVADLVIVAIFYVFPQIVLWLPNKMSGG